MSALKFTLYLLQWLTKLTLANVFDYDRKSRIFKLNKRMLYLVKFVFYFIIGPPMLITMLLMLAWSIYLVPQASNMGNLEGFVGIFAYFFITGSIVVLIKAALNLYIIYLLSQRLRVVERDILNKFIVVYAELMRLTGHRQRLQINWYIVLIVACKQCIFCGLYTRFLMKDFEIGHLFIPICLVPQAMLFITSFFGLVLLHAIFKTIHILVLNCQHVKFGRISKFIDFYIELLNLRRKYEKYVGIFLVTEIIFDFISMIAPVPYFLLKKETFKAIFAWIIISVYVLSLTHLTNDICSIETNLPNDLLRFTSKSISRRSFKLIEIFCLNKFLESPKQRHCFAILHLHKSFFLIFIGLFIENGILLYDMTKSEGGVAEWIEPSSHQEGYGLLPEDLRP